MTNKEEVFRTVIEQCGKPHQLIVCMEELSELTKEIAKNLRGYDNTAAISEEIADVEITLEQLKLIFSNRSEVDSIKAKKLMRLTDRMKSGVSL